MLVCFTCAQVVRQSTFYVPIASQFTFRLYAETFLSRAGVSDQDVKSMCLTMDFFPDGPGVNLTNTGYDLRYAGFAHTSFHLST